MMDELLAKLLETDVLSADTKSQLEEAFKKQHDEAVAKATEETEAAVRVELTEQWIAERDALIEAIDAKVTEFLSEEMVELKDDIDRFRDLEAEYAEKLVETKKEMAEELKGDMAELVEAVDTFLEMRLTTELEELHEDIEEVKKLDFGRKIFEGIVNEYRENFVDDDGVEAELHEARQQLNDALEQLAESERVNDQMERAVKLEEVLEPLSGSQRDVMEAILNKVPTDKLEEGYSAFLGRVLRESKEETSEKEDSVLAEGSLEDTDTLTESIQTVTGDVEDLEEGADMSSQGQLSEETRRQLKILGGVIDKF